MERIEQGLEKMTIEFLEKITTYPNESIHDDCVVAFTGGYEKIVSEKQSQRVDVDSGILHESYFE